MSQVKTKNTSVRSIIYRAAFVKGFNEVKTGKPFDYDYAPREPNDLWAYERGRLFAFVFDGKLKSGNKVLMSAMTAFASAYFDKAVI